MHNSEIPDEMSPYLVAGLLLLTGGLFTIIWIYLKNKELQKIYPLDLDPLRGISVLAIVPILFACFLWVCSLFLPKYVITIILYTIGTFILFAIFKYLFEFSLYASKIINSPLVLWFLPFCITLSGFILLVFKNTMGFPLICVLLIHIPILQSQFNVFYRNFRYKREKQNFFR